MLLGIAAAVLVSSALGCGLFLNAYVHALHAGFRERSMAYVQAFAAAATPWAERGDVEMLRAAAQLFLAGSARYVLISDGEAVFVDERRSDAEGLALEPQATDSTALLRLVEDGGTSYLDILVPLPSAEVAGYARIGIDRNAVLTSTLHAMMAGGGGTLGFDALLMAAFVFLLRRQRGEPRETPEIPTAETLRAGALEIDTERKRVSLGGSQVHVTPKQYLLLELLISQPGRVFTEREILEAAWPDSPYADAKDIKQYVYLVRQRLSEVDPSGRSLIETVPGFGYRLAAGDVDSELTG